VNHSDSYLRESAVRALGKLEGDLAGKAVVALAVVLKSGEALACVAAAEALEELGEEARPAIPPLLERLADREGSTRFFAAGALASIDPTQAGGALPVLREALRSDDSSLRRKGAQGLGCLGAAATDAAPELVAAMADPKPGVRQAAAWALGETDLASADVLSALRKSLDDPHDPTRINAASSLVVLRAGAADVLPALLAGLKHSDDLLRKRSAWSLGEIGGDLGKAAVAPLAEALGDSEAGVRIRAARALGTLGAAADLAGKVVEALVDVLKSGEAPARVAAAEVLEGLREEARPAIPALLERLADREGSTRFVAAWALASIDSTQAGGALPVLREALSHDDSSLRRKGAQGLGCLGAAATDAAPELVAAMADPKPGVRQAAAWALGETDLASADVLSALRKSLDDPHDPTRINAASSLVVLRAGAADVLPALLAGLKHSDDLLRKRSAWSLGEIGGDLGKAAVAPLAEALGDSEADVRTNAARALGKLGAAAEPALPALRRAEEDPDPEVRNAVGEAIKAIGVPR
jgi:HEAT repeat protein